MKARKGKRMRRRLRRGCFATTSMFKTRADLIAGEIGRGGCGTLAGAYRNATAASSVARWQKAGSRRGYWTTAPIGQWH
jgi:hypothetical protein